MRILLPPSEGKITPTAGPALDLDALVFPELGLCRGRVIDALESLGSGPEAAATLKLGAKSAMEATLNLQLRTAPSAPAIELYTGVLFEALDAPSFSPEQRQRLNLMTLIASGLFGFVRPDDPIPGHRLAIEVNLPPLGPLARWWRPHLEDALGDLSGEVIFDARSGGYQAAAPVSGATVIQLGVVRETNGKRRVVTHMAKKWRGLAAAHLVKDTRIHPGATGEGVVESLRDMAGSPRELAPATRLEVGPEKMTRAGGRTILTTLVVSA